MNVSPVNSPGCPNSTSPVPVARVFECLYSRDRAPDRFLLMNARAREVTSAPIYSRNSSLTPSVRSHMDSPSATIQPLDLRPPNFGESTGAGRAASLYSCVGQPEPAPRRISARERAACRRIANARSDADSRELDRLGLDRIVRVKTPRPRARTSHRRTPRATTKTSNADSDSDGPEPPGIRVALDVEHDAAVTLAGLLGEVAADLWLDGRWEVQP